MWAELGAIPYQVSEAAEAPRSLSRLHLPCSAQEGAAATSSLAQVSSAWTPQSCFLRA